MLDANYRDISGALKFMEEDSEKTSCKAQKTSMTQAEWKEIKKGIWDNKKFRNTNPNGECIARATLLSFELDKLGYKSEKIVVGNGRIAATLGTSNGFVVYPYTQHTANVITILDEKGKPQKYVLDPMFTNDLMTVESYIKSLGCSNDPALEYKIIPQTAEPEWDHIHQDPNGSCLYLNMIIEASEKLVQINQQVETEIGGKRIYNKEFELELPILGTKKDSAKKAFCQKTK